MPENKVVSSETEKVKKVFNGNQGIGGGWGLRNLIPYYNGNGFSSGDKVKGGQSGQNSQGNSYSSGDKVKEVKGGQSNQSGQGNS